MILPVASVVTEKTIIEFLLLKESLEQYHSCKWFISCDKATYDALNTYNNITFLIKIKTDDADHNIGNEIQKDNWMNIMMTKFDAVEMAIKQEGHVLFLDSDMIFVNPIEEKILSLFLNKDIDACICPHMTNDPFNEAKHGYYNAGMFHVKNLNLIEEWRNLSKNYKTLNFYFEQQPLEYVQRNFVCLNLPINYNIGWWRFNNEKTQKRLDSLVVVDDKINFGKLPAVNFHFHIARELAYQNFGKFLLDKVEQLFNLANNEKYKHIQAKIKEATK